MKSLSLFRLPTSIGKAILLGTIAAPAFAQDAGRVAELQRVIEAQQQQMEIQQRQLDEQKQLLQDLQRRMELLAREAPAVIQAPAATSRASDQAPVADQQNVVTTPEQGVSLSLSGWVNRAVNIVDDGTDTDAYFVDNDNAESRVNFSGTAPVTDDLTLGAMIELTIAPDRAGDIDQSKKIQDNVFEQRITEVTLDSKRYGKLSLGKGPSAAYGTGSRDLSQTNVIAYATVADTAGGMLFRQKSDGALTNIPIKFAFRTFDGLSRVGRLRYDTPPLGDFSLSAAAVSDERYDVALWWGGQGDGFKAIAGIGLADPNVENEGLQYDGSLSVLHEATGLNLSLSAGLQERDIQEDSEHYYVKLGWITNFFSFGDTAFSVDYAQMPNQPTEDDEGMSVGLAAVQFFEDYGTEVYALYRHHSLDRDVQPEVDDIDVLSVGVRVKF